MAAMNSTQQVGETVGFTPVSAHTPGPWTYHATAGNHDFAIYPEAAGRDVALVRDFHEANARLISAAPELLEALNAMVDEFKCDTAHTMGETRHGAIDALNCARTAIAKAEGRTP